MPGTSTTAATGSLALAVTWEARRGEADAVADILRRMASAVRQKEPGVLRFEPHRSPADDHVFFLYELFVDQAAFEAHQQTEHFKSLVVEQGLPKLARRERTPFTPLAAA
ncbi:putative quinol monooxygenase [Vineibacter terrae]|nr:putative quinol monooxygenase [Vineibacter terrae]